MSNFNLPNVASRVLGAPLMIEPGKARVIAEAFGPRIIGVVAPDAQADEDYVPEKRSGSILNESLSDHLVENKSGYIKHRGVAVIEVIGSLVRRGSWVGQSSGMTSYEGLRAQLKAAAADQDIKAIALEFDSPGGEAAGAFELADLVREIAAKKPVYAFCAEYAYSAAYALASQCSHITVPEFGGAGSIGVIMMHVDQSAKLQNEGLAVTIIRSGERKAEGNSIEQLPEALQAEWQSEADKMRVSFADLVGKGRGKKFDMAAALKTEARCFTGPEAVRLGLADLVADPKRAFDAMVAAVNENGAWDGTVPSSGAARSLSSSGCDNGADAAQQPKEAEMSKTKTKPENQVASGDKDVQAQDQVTTGPGAEASQAADAQKVVQAVSRAGLSAKFASDLLAEGVTMEVASERIIDAMAAKSADGGDIANHAPAANVVSDGVDRMKAGMVEALSAKAGLEGGKRNEFSSMSLRELARHTLNERGIKAPVAGGAMGMVGTAFVPSMAGGTYHNTSDFGEVLADVANKSMLKGYQEAPETFEKFTRRGVLTDFKATKRVGLGLFPALDQVEENGEFKFGTVGDHSETIVLATYGKLFSISRQAVINDDLSAFTQVPSLMGRAARRTVGSLVYALLSANNAMSDGTALFATGHSNLASAGALPDETSIDAAIQAMAQQKPRKTEDANASLNIVPKYLICGYANRAAVLAALNSEKTPSSANNKASGRYNTVYQAAEPIFDGRIKGNEWYMAADPNLYDTIEVAYLDGVEEPFIDQQDGWTVDGTEFKVRLDAGVAATAFEGLYKNPGQ